MIAGLTIGYKVIHANPAIRVATNDMALLVASVPREIRVAIYNHHQRLTLA